MAKEDFTVGTEGLRDFRRDLKRLDSQLDRELRVELIQAVGKVADIAAGLAPRKTGTLAKSYRPFVRARTAGVRSTLPYAGVHEFGGTISPKGTPITIAESAPVRRATLSQANRIVDQFGDAIERAANRAGWH